MNEINEDISRFHDRGYVVLRNLIDAETIERVRASLLASLPIREFPVFNRYGINPEAPDGGQSVFEKIDSLPEGSIPVADKQILTGHFSLETRLSPILQDIPKTPGVQNLLRGVLSSTHLRMHMPPTARFVTPGNIAAKVPAHQDRTYNEHLSDFVVLWVPFVPIDDLCQGMTIFEGSGSLISTETNTDKNGWITSINTEEFPPTVLAPLDIGDAVLMTSRIVHASRENLSNITRLSIDYRFFGERDTSKKHYLDMDTWQVIPPSE